jgi:hypothetical protein
VVVGALVGLGAMLLTAAVLGAAGSSRAHAAYREALRELREGDRRLEPGGVPRRLEDELRWYADVSASTRDAGWRSTAAVVLSLGAGSFVLGIWALADRPPALAVVAVVVLLVAVLLVSVLTVLDGRRLDGELRAAARRSALADVRRLEGSLVAVHRATAATRRAHRTWLRTRAADYPLASVLAAQRRRSFDRASAYRSRAVASLTRSVPVDLSGIAVRPPDGYAEGLRGLAPLISGAVLDDDTWASAVADLSRAAERDVARRTRWLFALAACAELREDPPARESAARWALEAAFLPARALGDARTDPLPDAVAIEPVRPETWEGALRRARTTGAGPLLLAEVTLHWAYALVSAAPDAAGAALDPAISAATEVMTETPDPDDYLRRVRPGFEDLGASSVQLSRLVPPWTAAPTPSPSADAERTPAPPA